MLLSHPSIYPSASTKTAGQLWGAQGTTPGRWASTFNLLHEQINIAYRVMDYTVAFPYLGPYNNLVFVPLPHTLLPLPALFLLVLFLPPDSIYSISLWLPNSKIPSFYRADKDRGEGPNH